jgi:signal recognition particle receptor subunit beta
MSSPDYLVIAKLVFAGPVGAGKSTAIATLAETAPVSTEMPLLESASGDKTTTTVALDFATAILDDGTPLFLYGLPGQDHFDFMREIVLEGAVAALVMLDGRSSDISQLCMGWIDAIHAIDRQLPLAFGVTHTELNSAFTLKPLRVAMRARGLAVPVFTVDARDRGEMMHLVRAVLVGLE